MALDMKKVARVKSNYPDVAGRGVLGGGMGVGGDEVVIVAVEVKPQLTVQLRQRVHHHYVVTAGGNCVDACQQKRFEVRNETTRMTEAWVVRKCPSSRDSLA